MKQVVVVLLFGSSFLLAGSPHKPSLVFTNAKLLDSRSRTESAATVIIRDETIVAVAKVAVIETGVDVRVINAGGKSIVPGPWRADTTVTPDQALHFSVDRAGTCGTGQEFSGIIKAGQTADLLLLEKAPNKDPCGGARITGVVLRGKYFSRADLEAPAPQQDKDEKAEARRAPATESMALK